MKNTKKSLVLSMVTLLLCLCTFVGSTFAWFTDTVSNTGNKIQAGTLDIDLLQRYDTMSAEQIKKVSGEHNPKEFISLDTEDLSNIGIFDYGNWEPGYTMVKMVKIVNKGNLALKYNLQFLVENEVKAPIRLADVIDVYVKYRNSTVPMKLSLPDKFNEESLLAINDGYDNGGFSKTTLSELIDDPDGAAHGFMPTSSQMAGGSTAVECIIILHMRENAGNEYQGLSVGDSFDIKLNATQYTMEKDGFGSDQYDAVKLVTNQTDLAKEIENAQPGDSIQLSDNIGSQPYEMTAIPEGVSISGNGDNTVMSANKTKLTNNNVTISNLKIIGSGAKGTEGELNISGDNTKLSNVTLEGEGPGVSGDRKLGITVSTQGNNKGTVFDGVKISNVFRGIQFWSLSGDTIIRNSIIDVPGYTFNIDAVKAESTLTIENTTLKGWTSYTNGVKLVTFKDCSFGENQYKILKAYSNTLVDSCNFCEGFKFSTAGDDDITLTINNSKVNDVAITVDNFRTFIDFTEGWNTKTTVIIDGVVATINQ